MSVSLTLPIPRSGTTQLCNLNREQQSLPADSRLLCYDPARGHVQNDLESYKWLNVLVSSSDCGYVLLVAGLAQCVDLINSRI